MIDLELLAWTRAVRLAVNDKLALHLRHRRGEAEAAARAPAGSRRKSPRRRKLPRPPAPKEKAPPPPPSAAQAGAVLTAKPDDTPVDFTNSFVTGNAETYAGGVTQTTGTSAAAVYDRNAQAGGVPGGTGTKPAPAAPAAPDRTRALERDELELGLPLPARGRLRADRPDDGPDRGERRRLGARDERPCAERPRLRVCPRRGAVRASSSRPGRSTSRSIATGTRSPRRRSSR